METEKAQISPATDHEIKIDPEALEMNPSNTKDGVLEQHAEDEAEEKAILWRIDLILIPMMFFTYMLNFMDKTGLGNAAVLGLIGDIGLHGQQFSWASSVFYFGYIAAEFPLTWIMVKFPLGKVLAILVIVWGVVLLCHAFAPNLAALAAVRVILGACEAAVIPCFTLLTGLFYKPSEHASRVGLWFYGNCLGGVLGSLIAYACGHVTGGPLPGWKWLFIILGVITILWGIFIYFLLPDSPLTARFLKPAQRPIANRRPQKLMRSFKTNKWVHSQFVEAMKDPQTWFLFIIIVVTSLTNGVLSNFTGLIINGLGFSKLTTLLLGMPLYGFQFVCIFVSMYTASKVRKSRLIILMVNFAIGIVGTVLIRQLPVENRAGRYAGVLLTLATSVILPMSLSIISTNIAGITKKSTINTVFLVGYCAGNIAGPQFFILNEAPNYITAFTALLALFCITIGLLALYRWYLVRENKRRDTVAGFYIDPEPRDDSPTAEDLINLNETREETDWENKRFRYHL